MVPETLSYVYKLCDEVYEYEDPCRQPQLQSLGRTLAQNSPENHDQDCKRN